MDDGIFFSIVNGKTIPTPRSKTKNSIARVMELERIDPTRMQAFLSALESGSSYSAAAGFLHITPDTMRRWMERGRTAKSGPYKQFHRRVIGSIQKAAAIAGIKVKEMQPLAWLQKGPGKEVGDDWSDQPKQVQVEVSGGITQSGKVRIEHVDMIQALRELQSAGVSLESLTMEAIKIGARDEETEGLDDEDESPDTQGTNYLGNGKYSSTNPSLPQIVSDRTTNSRPVPRLPAPGTLEQVLAESGQPSAFDQTLTSSPRKKPTGSLVERLRAMK